MKDIHALFRGQAACLPFSLHLTEQILLLLEVQSAVPPRLDHIICILIFLALWSTDAIKSLAAWAVIVIEQLICQIFVRQLLSCLYRCLEINYAI